MYLMPMNCTLKNGENDKFHVIYILSQSFLKKVLGVKQSWIQIPVLSFIDCVAV